MCFGIRKKNKINGKSERESRWDQAILGKYTLWFITPIIKKGYKNELNPEDIGEVPKGDHSRNLGSKLERNYNKELLKIKGEPSFLWALIKTFYVRFSLLLMLDFLGKCVAFPMQTLALGWIIRDTTIYLNLNDGEAAATAANSTQINNQTIGNATTIPVNEPSLSSSDAYMRIVYDAAWLIFFTMAALVTSHPVILYNRHIGMQVRVASCYLVYKKSLRLSQAALTETTVGQLVNLLSNDMNRFDQAVAQLPYIILAPLQAIVSLVLLATLYIGFYPALATFLTVFIYVVVQAFMGRWFSHFRAKIAIRTDERVRLMNEIIMAIRIIKMYAWEKPFKALVREARRREINVIAISSCLKVVNQTLFFISSKVIVYVSIMIYLISGGNLNAELLFVLIGLANLIRVSLTLMFPNAALYAAETVVSCRRINSFLQLPELGGPFSSQAIYKASPDGFGSKYALALSKVWCSWVPLDGLQLELGNLLERSDTSWAVVRDLSLTIRPRDLVLIVGRIGSGKSSLLLTILGELPLISGRLELNGRISYASQEAWIFSGSVRDNILFGRPLHQNRYRDVIRACSLERDLELLVEGDETIVGERGVSLSGGQKARVNLARALYADVDIYLLDDPLSAVDGPVATHIFYESLQTFLQNKTVIMATHQLQFLRHASKILVMDRERPAAFGTLQEVMDSEAFKLVNFSKDAFEDAKKPRTASESEPTDISVENTVLDRDNELGESGRRSPVMISSNQASAYLRSRSLSIKKDTNDTSSGQKVLNANYDTGGDRRSRGQEDKTGVAVELATYGYYIKNAASAIMCIWFTLINISAQAAFQMTDFFLSFWADTVERQNLEGDAFQPQNFIDLMTQSQTNLFYSLMVLVCFIFALLRASTYYLLSYRASIRIHSRLFNSILFAPTKFFDFSPIGVLLNRLSRDIGFVDELLPLVGMEIVTIWVGVSGIFVAVFILDIKNLGLTIGLLVTTVAFKMVASPAITRLKQLEGIERSPVFTQISTTIAGLSTIRASRVQENLIHTFDKHQDDHSNIWFAYICSSRWLAQAIDWVCLIFIALVVSLLVAFSLNSHNASLIGLLISQVVVLPGPFQWCIAQMIELESQMTSVQRIKEFSALEPEEDPNQIMKRPTYLTGFKPSRGELQFNSVSLSYFTDEPPVLKDLTFTIKAGEKIGIVGRTGAGKSSIVSILFRLYDFDGSILIDGVSTKDVSLSVLRQAISIIPQDPVLFGGTIRKNLDPFNEHSDERLWKALEAVQLSHIFSNHPLALHYKVYEGGINFSVGQRQLICLARAIVRRNKIIVLDEATANVDPETDVFIQRTIKNQFDDCTVLTIAHRLITILSSDRVLVLDGGQMREFDSPYELIKDEKGLFSQMLASTGRQAPRLRQIIKLERENQLSRKGSAGTSSH